MSYSGTVSLSKCCFALIFLFTTFSTIGQNVISVKKKNDTTQAAVPAADTIAPAVRVDEPPSFELTGFFYSEPFTLSTGRPGEPPTDFRRMIVYIDAYGRVYLFHSTQSVKKLYKKFANDPDKLTEEYGSIEITKYGDVYLKTQPRTNNLGSYKYVGDIISNKQFYLDYKATIDSKLALKVYLHKY